MPKQIQLIMMIQYVFKEKKIFSYFSINYGLRKGGFSLVTTTT